MTAPARETRLRPGTSGHNVLESLPPRKTVSPSRRLPMSRTNYQPLTSRSFAAAFDVAMIVFCLIAVAADVL